MGQTTEERIIAEALEERKEATECQFKQSVRAALNVIAQAQKNVTTAMLALAKARQDLKELKLEIVDVIV